MKTNTLLSIIICLATLLSGCNSGSVMTRATGFAYEIIVVMDRTDWNREVGEAVKAEIQAPVPGLPQDEPSFKITAVAPHEFNGLLTYVRNILIVRIDESMYTKVSVNVEANRWANGQVVMTVTSPDSEMLIEWLKRNPNHIVDYFTKVELDRTAQQLQSTYSSVVMDNVKEMFGISLKVPADITSSKKAENFFWASNNANTGRMDIVVYSFPYTDADTFTEDYLVAKRDSVMKENLPGAFPNSYMETEKRFELSYTPISVRGHYVGELRGLWRMVGDMMGGPFVSHTRLDEVNNQVIVVEGFVYAPETNKRNFIRRLEGSLYTLRLPGDAQ
ncbi:MAG: DUF4837 family protein [Tannerellaceae bacterium]|nr:DUF4837 family protein [Tannerellaceae bacterium]